MNAHVIAFAVHQIIRTASLLELRDARRIALYVGDTENAQIFTDEIARRMVS